MLLLWPGQNLAAVLSRVPWSVEALGWARTLWGSYFCCLTDSKLHVKSSQLVNHEQELE